LCKVKPSTFSSAFEVEKTFSFYIEPSEFLPEVKKKFYDGDKLKNKFAERKSSVEELKKLLK